MKSDLETKIKKLKDEVAKIENASKAEDKTLFTITAEAVSHGEDTSHIAISADFNKEQMALLCFMTGTDESEVREGIEKLVSSFSEGFVQMMLEQSENIKSTVIEEGE